MEKIICDGAFFNVKDTLECGQLFRFRPYKTGFLVFSQDKCAYCYNEKNEAVIECVSENVDFFKHYFDLSRDYSAIYAAAKNEKEDILSVAAEAGKGVRILNQNSTEALFSFIVSQNNNIPRIKGIIERLCSALGDEKTFDGETYNSFPSTFVMSKQDASFFSSIGLGYRAEYIRRLAVAIESGYSVDSLTSLTTAELKKELVKIYGVGGKVADCVAFFGFHRSDSFPVDVWIDKVYRENFHGLLTDRDKIAREFTLRFGDNAGYFQQYLFYYKRSIESSERKSPPQTVAQI